MIGSVSGVTLYAVCSALYLFSDGRPTFVLVGCVALWLISSHESQSRPVVSEPKRAPKAVKESPIYAVDFTSTVFTPSTTTQIPRSTKARVKRKILPKVIKGVKPVSPPLEAALTNAFDIRNSQVYIFYTTLTGSSQRVAQAVFNKLSGMDELQLAPKFLSLDDDVDDLEEFFMKTPENDNGVKNTYVLVLPSYEMDSPMDYFLEHLQDTYQDFRVDKYPLSKLAGFAVLGLGDSESWGGDKFCYQSKAADRWLGKLGARRLFPLGQVCMKYQGEPKTQEWIQGFAEMLLDEEPIYLDDNEDIDDSDMEDDSKDNESDDTLVDVEDMGTMMRKGVRGETVASSGPLPAKEMVSKNSPTYKSLTKQGYTIVGSHSGVKICRWTKSALRGRGSCYKFAFYGIRSHLCMETTPSLACSNKCVFCWRHGTNPVAKSNWRWEVDEPEVILNGALEGHYKKIKQLRGVPGVQLDRFQEAFTVRHCALSLVGEPIFYPHINEFVQMLHAKHISSFLVCNAQHPDHLARLGKVTQLYVSIDAPTKTDLKKVDRPLNSDFWERLMLCLDILRTVQSHQRTVFRLTLVKGFNMSDVESYADMVERACPSQIEIKGATFCGSSSANGNPLTMQNIPFYDECRSFVEDLCKELQRRGLDYEIAAEHAHSCCILMAHTRFKKEGKWYTHIDYAKFFSLLESGEQFTDVDYFLETPEWAYYGSDEAGFNPDDTRFDRKAEKMKKRLEREKQGDVNPTVYNRAE